MHIAHLLVYQSLHLLLNRTLEGWVFQHTQRVLLVFLKTLAVYQIVVVLDVSVLLVGRSDRLPQALIVLAYNLFNTWRKGDFPIRPGRQGWLCRLRGRNRSSLGFSLPPALNDTDGIAYQRTDGFHRVGTDTFTDDFRAGTQAGRNGLVKRFVGVGLRL